VTTESAETALAKRVVIVLQAIHEHIFEVQEVLGEIVTSDTLTRTRINMGLDKLTQLDAMLVSFADNITK
jgi:hypothetical protein